MRKTLGLEDVRGHKFRQGNYSQHDISIPPSFWIIKRGIKNVRDEVPGKRGNRKSEVLGLDLSGNATNQELATARAALQLSCF